MVLDGGNPPIRPRDIARLMTDRMIHRGPDSAGVWENESGSIALGHRRLAIVDLTESGHQPMTSADGRWTITYNGELYNASALRDQLGIPRTGLRGHSDTEILIEAIAKVGIDKTLDHAIGMFAFAAFDRNRDELWIARDRFGEKPLYYTVVNGMFAIASELSALQSVPGFSRGIDRFSLVELLERSAISAPHTIFEGVSKLEPGSFMCVRRDGSTSKARYFDPSAIALGSTVSTRSDAEAIDEFEHLLAEIVLERTIADVPLGAFLSGGIDSSMIVVMMQRANSSRVKTFTIGFEIEDLNEAPAARTIANALGTEHHEWIVTGNDALDIVPDLGRLYDEPFADPSQIPTILVSRFAQRDVTVALSGDGGDELFGGYERYRLLERVQRYRRLPGPALRAGAWALNLLSEETLDRLGASPMSAAFPQHLQKRTGKRVHTAAEMLGAPDNVALYDLMTRPHRNGPHLVLDGARRPLPVEHYRVGNLEPIQMGMAIDTIDYLPNDILTKVDRASMSTSLEVRAPMLDHRLHAFAWSLTPDQRVRGGVGKWLLREALRNHVPEVADLPKRGFGVPLDDWLRGPLRQWGEGLLDTRSMRSHDLFDVEAVHAIWRRHQSGTSEHATELWPILMFQAWSR
jgi:asparagine synthase (glutamine-hydrolysing)